MDILFSDSSSFTSSFVRHSILLVLKPQWFRSVFKILPSLVDKVSDNSPTSVFSSDVNRCTSSDLGDYYSQSPCNHLSLLTTSTTLPLPTLVRRFLNRLVLSSLHPTIDIGLHLSFLPKRKPKTTKIYTHDPLQTFNIPYWVTFPYLTTTLSLPS